MNVPTQSISGSEVTTSTTTQSDDSYVINRPGVGLITVPVTAEGGAALRTFDSVADMAAAQTLVPGTICIIANDTYRVVAASTYTANGVEVVDLASYQAVLLGKTVSLTDTRPIAFWTGEYGASGTIELTAGAYRYSLDLTQAATADVSTAGGVGLQLLGDTTDLTALGAVDGADPAGREAFVSAMATSMTRRGIRSISFRDLVGYEYDIANGAEAVFQAAIDAGLAIRNDEAMEVGFAVALKPKDGTEIYQAQGGRMRRIAADSPLFFRDTTGEFLESGVSIDATAGGAITVTTTTNTLAIGDRVRIGGMSSDRFLNGTLAVVASVAGNVATLEATSPVAISNTGFVSRINWVDKIRLIGGEWGAFEDESVTGVTAFIFMSNSVVDVTVDGARDSVNGGLPLSWAGDNNVVKMRCHRFEEVTGVGGPRLLGGRNNTVVVRGWTGDDHCNCVPVDNPTNIAYDWDIVGATFDCRGGSHKARMVAVALDGPSGSGQMQARIHDVEVNANGYAGNRGIVIKNSEGVGWQGQIDNIRVFGEVSGAKQAYFVGQPSDLVNIVSAVAGGIGRIHFAASLRENNRRYGVEIAADGALVDFTGARLAGEGSPLNVVSACTVRIGKNSTLQVESPLRGFDDYNSGSDPKSHAAVIATAGARLIGEGAVFEGISNTRAAVRINNVDSYAYLNECEVNKEAGATTARVFSFEVSATVEAGVINGDYDDLFNGTGWGKSVEGLDHLIFSDNVAGVTTVRAPSRNFRLLSETAGTADDVDTITVEPEWLDGTEITVRKFRGGDTLTLKDGTGNLRLGADVIISTGDDFAVLRLLNNNWYLLVDAT